jgi:hypothetical protein
MRPLAFALCLIAVFTTGGDTAWAEQRVALVIGNGNYRKVPALPNPSNDAIEIGASLTRLGFSASRLTDATATEMRKGLIDFGRAAQGSEMAIIYYAGHGMEVGGENWLIPVDAALLSDTDAEQEAVSLRGAMLQAGKASKLGLVILDACRNNPFMAKMQRSSLTRAVTRGLVSVEPTDNLLVAYAAKDGTVANDGDDKHSPFTAALLHNLETPGLEINFLFRNVRDEVMASTNRQQQPFVYGSLSKEAIYLKPVEAGSVPNRESAVSNDQKRREYTPDDAQHVTSKAADLKLKLPKLHFGDLKAGVQASSARFVGAWATKIGFGGGKGRQAMLIVTEALPNGLVFGYYAYGPPTKYSWNQSPASFMKFAVNISDGQFTFNSGNIPITAVVTRSNEVKLSSTLTIDHRLRDKSEATLEPIWQMIPQDRATTAKGP